MSENLATWEALCRPPESALKKIGGGRLKGMTDINPQWRLQMMTEQFGPIGVGWYYEKLQHWTEIGGNDELMCFVSINLYIKHDGEWSKPIFGLGGSTLVASQSAGLYSNDEGYKMALTDALSVAMKELGVAAAIYQGLWDGSKYVDIAPQPLNRPAAKAAVSQFADEPFPDGIELPAEYPDFTALVNDHSGKKGINELRNVGVQARAKGWTQDQLLSWVKDQGVDLADPALLFTDFAKLNFEIQKGA